MLKQDYPRVSKKLGLIPWKNGGTILQQTGPTNPRPATLHANPKLAQFPTLTVFKRIETDRNG